MKGADIVDIVNMTFKRKEDFVRGFSRDRRKFRFGMKKVEDEGEFGDELCNVRRLHNRKHVRRFKRFDGEQEAIRDRGTMEGFIHDFKVRNVL